MEKRFWVGYLILVLVSSIFGDTVILVVSAKQHAFKLNVIIVAIIQHMAACDLIISVTYVGPTIISIIIINSMKECLDATRLARLVHGIVLSGR